jgi:micrococcal nuclease
VYKSNYDGDTLRLDIDLGMGVWLHNQSVRLYGIDTPELRSIDPDEKHRAYRARDFVQDLLTGTDTITIKTHKDKTGKYGRWLAVVYINQDENLNKMLVDARLASIANY